MARKVDEIRLLSPKLAPMTDEQHGEAVDLLPDLILDAARRRALDKGAASVGVRAGVSSCVTPVVLADADQAATPHQSRGSGSPKKPTYKGEDE